MTISYNWLCDYLPERIEPEKLSKILTSIGLEVESLEKYESIKGGLAGLVIGEVLECEQHPNADKLKLTRVNIGKPDALKIVCGAPNVAVGQKVVVATVGTTIYPSSGEPLTMKVAKIRGEESHGMICAEDEIGLGESHVGIMILPADTKVGIPAAEYFKIYNDYIYEIGLTPNRMDAMSHLGVARDVCAYLTHHNKKDARPKAPYSNAFKADNHNLSIKVTIENTQACQRYAGVSITGITVKDSPQWLKDKLQAIGVRSINNIVDITNFVLHETGQPLHAFDADAIKGNSVVVKNLPEGTLFKTLDDKERKLSEQDLMICNAEEGMCIAGVFGGIASGVKDATRNIFLESAWFNPVDIRKTSLRHGLRTDAATHFEKGVDISNTVNVLKRAALLIKEVAGGEIASDVVDVYPSPKDKVQVALKNHYLKKLSGKNYHPDTVKKILVALGFEWIKEGIDDIWVAVPYSKPDITLPADIVEEIVRIDGLDNIAIPQTITISPAVEEIGLKESLREKIAYFLTGQGFHEIVTNSITNSKYYTEEVLATTVKMINNLSADLDVLRPSMLQTGLETIAYNINRKNADLRLFEFGKTYHTKKTGSYTEEEFLCLYLTGATLAANWKEKNSPLGFYDAKGLIQSVIAWCGLDNLKFEKQEDAGSAALNFSVAKQHLGTVIEVSRKQLAEFDIKQPVYFIELNFLQLIKLVEKKKISYSEVPKFPAVQRDLALVVDRQVSYEAIEKAVAKLSLQKLQQMRLFDVFESDKLGAGKKSMAINFTFLDEEKTLTDKEIEGFTNKLIRSFEEELGAEIRK